MAFLLRHLVAFSVALHGALGCCAHHAHAVDCDHHTLGACCHAEDAQEHAAAQRESRCACQHAQPAEGITVADDESHSHHKHCDGAGCSFAASAVKVSPSKAGSLPLFLGYLIPLAANLAAPSRALGPAVGAAPIAGFAGLALHLALQRLVL